MAIPDSEIMAKAREVRDKAVQKWMETEAGAFAPAIPEYQGQVREAFAFIETMFESHTQRDPSRLDAIRDDLRNVRFTLMNPVTEGIDTVKGKVQDWTGEAAEQFWGEYLEELPKVNENQLALVGMLDAVIDGIQTLLDQSRQRIIAIGDQTLQALDGIEEGSGGGGGLGLGLTIVAAVAGVIAAVPTLGASTAVTFAVIAGASSIGAAVAADADEMTISGTNVTEVINNMVTANTQLWETQRTVEQDIAGLLNEDLNQVNQNWSFFRPPLPFIGEFNPTDGLSPAELADFVPPAR